MLLSLHHEKTLFAAIILSTPQRSFADNGQQLYPLFRSPAVRANGRLGRGVQDLAWNGFISHHHNRRDACVP
jgi:hypothetical protein